MKKLSVVFALFLFSCQNDPSVSPDLENLTLINVCGENSGETTLVSGDMDLGKVKMKMNQSRILNLDYSLLSPYLLKSVAYNISTKISEVPLSGDEPNVSAFKYSENDIEILADVITGNESYKGKLYVFAFAEIALRKPLPSGSLEATVTRTHTQSAQGYFQIAFNNAPNDFQGEFTGFCLQGDQNMDASKMHNVNLLSSNSTDLVLLNKIVDNAAGLNAVNWIINQDARKKWGNDADGADIQMAIWKLIERTGNPTGSLIAGFFDAAIVSKIVLDATTHGTKFKPQCGQKELIILHKGPIYSKDASGNYNSGNYSNPNFQVAGIVAEVTCDESSIKKAWGKGTIYPGSAENAQYFGYCLQ